MRISNEIQQVLDQFFFFLRMVGCSYVQKQLSNKTINDIDHVKRLYEYLKQHNIIYESQINELSEQCNWDLKQLVKDILKYPTIIPRVKRLDGTLHYTFKEPVIKPVEPLDKKIRQYLVQVILKVNDIELRDKLLNELNKERINMLYITAELGTRKELSQNEKEYLGQLFMRFY